MSGSKFNSSNPTTNPYKFGDINYTCPHYQQSTDAGEQKKKKGEWEMNSEIVGSNKFILPQSLSLFIW